MLYQLNKKMFSGFHLRMLALALLFSFSELSQAGIEESLVSLQGSELVNNAELKLKDSQADYIYNHQLGSISPYTDLFGMKSVQNMVKLRFDNSDGDYHGTDWTVSVGYTLTGKDETNATVVKTGSLSIDYDPLLNYTDVQMRLYEDLHECTLEVTSITANGSPIGGANPFVIPGDLYLDLSMRIERYYVFDTTYEPVIYKNDPYGSWYGTNNTSGKMELDLSWDYIVGAETYDLEWLFIDVSELPEDFDEAYCPVPEDCPGIADLEIDFRKASRVNLWDNHYNISLAYPRGYLIYRVRGVGVGGTAFNERVNGSWSESADWADFTADPQGSSSSDFIGYAGLEHSKNWQYSVAYAEEGKRKELISYFDGSLRNRQSVTVLNTEEHALVGETLYDYEGRAAVNILPSPVADGEGLAYHSGMSKYDTDTYYDRAQFDTDALLTTPSQVSATDSEGAAAYYSSSNQTSGVHKDLIPDAEGFPYTRTVYTQDGSNRPLYQSGAGESFRMGSGHETTYVYGKPSGAEELDRLFGNEVGLEGYRKEMVKDANGQVTINYMDRADRTIATALTGGPSNLKDLDTSSEPESLSFDLLEGNNILSDLELISTSDISPEQDGTYKFTYTIEESEFQYLCETTELFETPIECIYTLQVYILDNGEYKSLSIEEESIGTTSFNNGGDPLNNLNQDIFTESGIKDPGTLKFTVDLEVGHTYQVIKKLMIDEVSYDSAEVTFINAWTETDSGCFNRPIPVKVCGCAAECMYDQGYEPVYNTDGDLLHFIDENDLEIELDDELYKQCAIDCGQGEPITKIDDECEMRKEALIDDMGYYGQYFNNTPFEGTLSYDRNAWLDEHVLISEANTALGLTLGDAFDNWEEVKLAMEGDLTSTGELSSNWDDLWDMLLSYHPEYELYEFYCEGVTFRHVDGDYSIPGNSHGYKSRLHLTNDDQEAKNLGLFNPYGFYGSVTSLSLSEIDGDPVTVNPPASIEHMTANYTTTAPSGYTHDTYFLGDALLSISAQPYDAMLEELYDYLDTFLTDGTTTYTIWDVLAYPDDLGDLYDDDIDPLITLSTTTSDYLDLLYTSETGILADDNPYGMSRIMYYRSIYLGYRSFLQYKNAEIYANDEVGVANNFYLEADDIVYGTECYQCNPTTFFTIRYPMVPAYESVIAGGSVATSILADAESDCNANMDDYTNAIMSWLYSGCGITTGLTTTEIEDIEDYILTSLQSVCSSTDSNVFPANSTNVIAGVSISFTTLDAEITFDDGSCVETYSLPENEGNVSEIPDDPANCACDAFNDFVATMGISNPDDSQITSALITAGYISNASEYSAQWKVYCDEDVFPVVENLLGSDFPLDMYCYDEDVVELMLQTLAPDWFACEAFYIEQTENIDLEIYNAGLLALEDFSNEYRSSCMSSVTESFIMERELDQYHYTLYYYDQAGNLIKTVPPTGVNVLIDTDDLDDVADYRVNYNNFIHPSHNMITNYKYNSLNNIREQTTPDGGTTQFWYDELGRLILSQNARQAEVDANGRIRFSYVCYDALGRTVESGELSTTRSIPTKEFLVTKAFASDYSPFETWLQLGKRSEVVKSNYDKAITFTDGADQAIFTSVMNISQRHLRMRIASTHYFEGPIDGAIEDDYVLSDASDVLDMINSDEPSDITTLVTQLGDFSYPEWDNASHYAYDLHGNVKRLIQETYSPYTVGRIFKRMDYSYDLVSGNVNEVIYQPNTLEQFAHRYHYDADNRIVEVETSRDRVLWSTDARYFYYSHGPLARVEIGDEQVQALDYAYTIQGWLKSVNSGSLVRDRDPGSDALEASSNLNAHFAADAAGFNLTYFDGDYNAIGNDESFLSKFTNTDLGSLESYRNLYNGNISNMVTAIPGSISGGASSQATRYTYDQLNRIKSMDVYQAGNMDTDVPFDATDKTNNYATSYSYDGNGNLTFLTRNDDIGFEIDSLSYAYYHPSTPITGVGTVATNRLALYHDPYQDTDPDPYHVESIFSIDSKGNKVPHILYTYDATGNLIQDKAEEIEEIRWTVSGKVKEVIRQTGSTKPNLEFQYDSQGNRISKIVKPNTGGVLSDVLEWTVTHYVHDASGQLMSTYTENYVEAGATGDNNYISVRKLSGQPIYGSSRLGIDENNKLSKITTFAADIDTNLNFVDEDTTKVNDTYMVALDPGTYGVFHQGDIVISTHSGDMNILLYSDVDVLIKQDNVPDQTLTGGVEHDVIIKDGTVYEIGILGTSMVLNTPNSISAEVTDDVDIVGSFYDPNLYQLKKGNKRYELSNHLGNVLATISDRKLAKESVTLGELDYYTAAVLSYSDYYPFGMEMPKRKSNSSDYRFGFNGKEKDDETYAEAGTFYDYGFRVYSPRLGKFLSVDPLTKSYPWYTPYQFAGNMPIWAIDLDGLEEYIVTNYYHGKDKEPYRTTITVVTETDNENGAKENMKVLDPQGKRATEENVLVIDKRGGNVNHYGAKKLSEEQQGVFDNGKKIVGNKLKNGNRGSSVRNNVGYHSSPEENFSGKHLTTIEGEFENVPTYSSNDTYSQNTAMGYHINDPITDKRNQGALDAAANMLSSPGRIYKLNQLPSALRQPIQDELEKRGVAPSRRREDLTNGGRPQIPNDINIGKKKTNQTQTGTKRQMKTP